MFTYLNVDNVVQIDFSIYVVDSYVNEINNYFCKGLCKNVLRYDVGSSPCCIVLTLVSLVLMVLTHQIVWVGEGDSCT